MHEACLDQGEVSRRMNATRDAINLSSPQILTVSTPVFHNGSSKTNIRLLDKQSKCHDVDQLVPRAFLAW